MTIINRSLYPANFLACVDAEHRAHWIERAITGGPGAQWWCDTCGYAGGYNDSAEDVLAKAALRQMEKHEKDYRP